MDGVRRVILDLERGLQFGEVQMNYLNYRTWRLIPSTEVHCDNGLLYRTNALGCKGGEIEPGKPVIGFFGDSVIHGISEGDFVDRVRLPGCQPLNAAIEGMILPWIVDRFLELREQTSMVCAAVHSGWHNIVYNEIGEDYWAAQFDRIQGVPLIAHFKLTCDISMDAVQLGYASVLERLPGYGLWSAADFTSPKGRQACWNAIERFNNFIEAYCRDRGRLLIDFSDVIGPRSINDIGVQFADFIHPAARAFDPMARAVEQQLGPAVAALLDDRSSLAI